MSRVHQFASLEAYPNLQKAADLLGVSASTLSRRNDLKKEPRGDRDLVVAAGEVLRLAAIYRKRSLNDVAQDLIDLAAETSREAAERVEQEIDAFFANRAISDERSAEFLDIARRLLPASLYKEVESAVLRPSPGLPDGVSGYPPMPEDQRGAG